VSVIPYGRGCSVALEWASIKSYNITTFKADAADNDIDDMAAAGTDAVCGFDDPIFVQRRRS